MSPFKLARSSGHYQVQRNQDANSKKAANGFDENNNNSSNSEPRANVSTKLEHEIEPTTTSYRVAAEIGQLPPRRCLKKLRPISFSRLIYLRRSQVGSYSLELHSNATLANSLTNPTNCQQQQHDDGVTLCTLGAGTTFGASVMPGKSHSVSVVTNEECTLLRVRRADFQEIFRTNGQQPAAESAASLFYPLAGSARQQAESTVEMASSAANQRRRSSLATGRRAYEQHCRRQSLASSGNAATDLSTNSLERQLEAAKLDERGAPHCEQSSQAPTSSPNENELRQTTDGTNLLADLKLESWAELARAAWTLHTLILAEAPHMVRDRHVQASQLLAAAVGPPMRHTPTKSSAGVIAPLRRHLVSRVSSSQLLSTSAGGVQPTASAAKSAGRKVANYVASSFMRKQPVVASQQQVTTGALNNGRYSATSTSFDQNYAATPPPPPVQLSESGDMPPAPSVPPLSVPSLAQPPLVVELRRALVGREMVDWLLQLGQTSASAGRFVSSRLQALSMWQVLLEQGLIERQLAPPADQIDGEQQLMAQNLRRLAGQFSDEPNAYYAFSPAATVLEPEDADQVEHEAEDQETHTMDSSTSTRANNSSVPYKLARSDEARVALACESLWWALQLLSKLAPNACFRLILSKRPHERSAEEVDIVYEELQHLKALSHLSNSVKKQLAACVQGEQQARQNTVVFNQGDVGHSWYIILRGSVNVVIVSKGVVCTLHDGDDFGKLALVNDAPRAATIVTSAPHCYFLRVDKRDFNTILRDVEANTVRLKEHGKEVLILQKVALKENLTPAGKNQETSPVAGQDPVGQQSGAISGTMQVISSNTDSSDNNNNHVHEQPTTGGAATGASAGTEQQAGQQLQQQAAQQALKYLVMAGTAEKMLEHLLETRIDGQTQTAPLPLNKLALFQHDQVANYIQCQGDNFLEDFILTHKIFMPTGNLCQELLKQYQSSQAKGPTSAPAGAITNATLDDEYLVAKKRRVIKFVRFWMLINREHFFQQPQIQAFVMTLHQKVKLDAQRFTSLQAEWRAISRIHEFQLEENLEARHRGCQRWIEDVYGNMLPIRRHSGSWQLAGEGAAQEQFLAALQLRRFEHRLSTIQPGDELVFRVYCADHSFTTLKCRFDQPAGHIKQLAARNLQLDDKELILVHLKSNGERLIYNDLEANISTCLSVNGRLFVCPLDHIDALSPLPEQDPFQEVYQSLANTSLFNGDSSHQISTTQFQQQQQLGSLEQQENQQPTASSSLTSHLLAQTPTNYHDIRLQMGLSVGRFEEFSSRDIAYCLTQLAWSLLKNMHEFELVYTVFGRHTFNKQQVTANLNVFLRHFNEIQYWVVTQICLSTSLSKRVQILRKFIKIAAHCKELQNLNAFFAIIMGLSNMAVARLTQTWERLPNKLKRTFSQFESQIDPSRNHRRYRLALARLEPPIVPFMPLFLKDMTFAHEGNKTHLENGLINFEKMQMVAQTLRTVRYCKSRPLKLDVASVCKFKSSIRSIELFFRDIKIIDNQRTLTQMSHQLEHRKA